MSERTARQLESALHWEAGREHQHSAAARECDNVGAATILEAVSRAWCAGTARIRRAAKRDHCPPSLTPSTTVEGALV